MLNLVNIRERQCQRCLNLNLKYMVNGVTLKGMSLKELKILQYDNLKAFGDLNVRVQALQEEIQIVQAEINSRPIEKDQEGEALNQKVKKAKK